MDIKKNYQAICESLAQQSSDADIIAVSKKLPIKTIKEAYEAGIEHFGENYLQEAIEKIQALKDLKICWHYIGSIQSNKTKGIAQYFDWVHSVDSLKIAQKLNRHRQGAPSPLKTLVMVNIDHSPSKSRILPGPELDSLLAYIHEAAHLELCGLMCMPDLHTPHKQGYFFQAMQKLQGHYQAQFGSCMQHLSMGTSQDYLIAAMHGATMLRLGTCLLGPRPA